MYRTLLKLNDLHPIKSWQFIKRYKNYKTIHTIYREVLRSIDNISIHDDRMYKTIVEFFNTIANMSNVPIYSKCIRDCDINLVSKYNVGFSIYTHTIEAVLTGHYLSSDYIKVYITIDNSFIKKYKLNITYQFGDFIDTFSYTSEDVFKPFTINPHTREAVIGDIQYIARLYIKKLMYSAYEMYT